jgi:hypothetical protein
MTSTQVAVPGIRLKSIFDSPLSRGTWSDAALGLLIGICGGLVRGSVFHFPLLPALLLGGAFGLVFGLFFAKRASSPGAGLIWGLSSALLLWFIVPAATMVLQHGIFNSGKMLEKARNQFPELVAYLMCLGMPTGLVLGIRGGFRRDGDRTPFRWSRAV